MVDRGNTGESEQERTYVKGLGFCAYGLDANVSEIDVKDGRIGIEDICEEQFSNYLYTTGLPDPDLLIRTSGEMRISNFLLWQLAYAEIYVTPTLWPDFRRQELLVALISYQQRQRRFGGLTNL